MFVPALGKFKNKQIHGITSNSERYITFPLSGLQFIESFQFLGLSLEKLVESLSKEEFQLQYEFVDENQKRSLLLRKGVYTYDYVDSPAKFYDAELPRKEQFTLN